MSSKITLFIGILLSSLTAQAQISGSQMGFTGDTTAYIYDVVAEKARYLNKTVNNLLGNLELPIVHYVPKIVDGNKMAVNVKLVGILFYTARQESAIIKKAEHIPIGINIYFSPTVPKSRLDSIDRKYSFLSNTGLSELFGQCLVTDIAPIK